jgi:ribulose kinase
VFVPGVWGPYRVIVFLDSPNRAYIAVQDAVFPGWWMNEGGQSSTGQLIDFVLKTHPAYSKLQQAAEGKGIGIYQCDAFCSLLRHTSNVKLIDLTSELQKQMTETECKSPTELTKHIHFYPDLHGKLSSVPVIPSTILTKELSFQETDRLLLTQR